MASGLRLITLKCEKCGSLLNADPKDVVYYCGHCGTGYELISEKDELVPMNIDFAVSKKPVDAAVVYLPFWVFDADIQIGSRDSSGSVTGFLKKALGGNDSERTVDKFYVPAFDAPLENIKKLGLEFTKHQPDLETIKKDRITGGICSSRDAEKLADFIFLSSEAEKPDTLKHISYTMGLSNKRVVGIPFYKTSEKGLTDGILGIKI